MLTTLTPSLSPHQARFAGWLAVAMLLHALLLLIPAQRGLTPGPAANSLAVVLIKAWQAAPGAAELNRARAEPEPVPSPPEPRSAPEPATSSKPGLTADEAPRSAAPAREAATSPDAGSPDRPVTAARLLDLANPREWRLPGKPGEYQPGDPASPSRPNWRPGTDLGRSRFDGRALPERVEIVDRWLAPDGSHNVMIEMPTGEMLCGRAAAWDPTQPLVEPVMMYRSCGPARSTFEWPEHYGGAGSQPRQPR